MVMTWSTKILDLRRRPRMMMKLKIFQDFHPSPNSWDVILQHSPPETFFPSLLPSRLQYFTEDWKIKLASRVYWPWRKNAFRWICWETYISIMFSNELVPLSPKGIRAFFPPWSLLWRFCFNFLQAPFLFRFPVIFYRSQQDHDITAWEGDKFVCLALEKRE